MSGGRRRAGVQAPASPVTPEDPDAPSETSESARADGAEQVGGNSILRSSAVMAAGTVASRLLGFVRSTVFTMVLGAGVIGNTFGAANTVPNILYLLIAGGVINSVFVPQLVRAQREDADGGSGYADRLLTVSGLVLLAVMVLATICSPWIFRFYAGDTATAEALHLGSLMAAWCLPQIFFYGAFTMLGQVSNARGRFGPMMWAPLVNNVVALGGVALFVAMGHRVDPDIPTSMSALEVAIVAGASTLGVVAQAAVLVPSLRRAGYRYRPRFDLRGAGLGKAASLAKWTIAFVAVNQVAYFIVLRITYGAGVRLAAETGGGTDVLHRGTLAYQNAYLYFILPHSVITVSLVTALLPAMSAAAHAGDQSHLRSLLSNGLRDIAVLLAPAAVLLITVGPMLGAAVTGGNYTAADGQFVGVLLQIFALGLLPFSAHHMLLRTFYAADDTRTPFLLTCVVAATNAVLALCIGAFVTPRGQAPALALAYVASYWIGAAVAGRVVARRLDGWDPLIVRTFTRAVVAAVAAGIPAALVVRLAEHRIHSRPGELLVVLAAGLLLAGGYVVAAKRLHLTELDAVLATLTGRLRP